MHLEPRKMKGKIIEIIDQGKERKDRAEKTWREMRHPGSGSDSTWKVFQAVSSRKVFFFYGQVSWSIPPRHVSRQMTLLLIMGLGDPNSKEIIL
jgi:hypothetical protein